MLGILKKGMDFLMLFFVISGLLVVFVVLGNEEKLVFLYNVVFK